MDERINEGESPSHLTFMEINNLHTHDDHHDDKNGVDDAAGILSRLQNENNIHQTQQQQLPPFSLVTNLFHQLTQQYTQLARDHKALHETVRGMQAEIVSLQQQQRKQQPRVVCQHCVVREDDDKHAVHDAMSSSSPRRGTHCSTETAFHHNRIQWPALAVSPCTQYTQQHRGAEDDSQQVETNDQSLHLLTSIGEAMAVELAEARRAEKASHHELMAARADFEAALSAGV